MNSTEFLTLSEILSLRRIFTRSEGRPIVSAMILQRSSKFYWKSVAYNYFCFPFAHNNLQNASANFKAFLNLESFWKQSGSIYPRTSMAQTRAGQIRRFSRILSQHI
jgi:hypothetical protein